MRVHSWRLLTNMRNTMSNYYLSRLILRNRLRWRTNLLRIFDRFLGLRDFGEICMEAQAFFVWENSQFSTKLIKIPTTSLKVKIISNYSGDLAL